MRINLKHLDFHSQWLWFSVLFVFFSQGKLSKIKIWLLANPLVSSRRTVRGFPCLFFSSTLPCHFSICFVQGARWTFIHHSPKAESTWDKGRNSVLTLCLAQCWPGTLRPTCVSAGDCWQMVSPTPASVSPLAGWGHDGLTSSAKCFVKASFSFSSGSA